MSTHREVIVDGANPIPAELEPLLRSRLVVEKAGICHLSDAGRAAERALQREIEGIWDRMVDGLDGDDYTYVVETLETTIGSLSA